MSEPNLLPVPIASGAIVGVNVEALLAKAVDAKAAVEVLERLMVMRRELQAEQAKAQFDKALAAFQAECPVIVKSEPVHERESSTKVRYRYAPLDVIVSQVKGILEKHGLSHTETAKVENEWVTAICTVKHCAGHSEQSEFKVPIDPKAFMNAAQKFASALTFAKRYAFCNALGILTGDADDDATGAHPEPAKNAPGRSGPPSTSTPPAQSSRATPPVKAAGHENPPATPETRQKLIEKLMTLQGVEEPIILEFYRKLASPAVLMDNEGLLDLPLRFVPTTLKQYNSLVSAILDFQNGGEARHPFPPHNSGSVPSAATPSAGSLGAVPPPRSLAEGPRSNGAAWETFPMPFGKHAGVPLRQLDKAYLFGLWANYEVEEEYNGKPKRPETIAKDEKFREMLDAAGQHYEFTKKD